MSVNRKDDVIAAVIVLIPCALFIGAVILWAYGCGKWWECIL